MFIFEREQYVYTIGNIRIGGTRGENPTVLVGTLFHKDDNTVRSAQTGELDRDMAIRLIEEQDRMSRQTGNPAMIQIVAESVQAMTDYIDLVADTTSAPFLIGAPSPEVRIAGLRHAEETGLVDRAVYDSISISVTDSELETLADVHPEAAVILAFNPRDATIAGKRAVLEEPIPGRDRGLLALSADVGVTKPLIDTAAAAIGAGAGTAVSFTLVAKTLYGHPTGSGIRKAPASWRWLMELRREEPQTYEICDISSGLLVQAMGGDFVLYGPIANAQHVFPIVAMADMFAAESAQLEFGVEPGEEHPFRRLL